jgi:four helix bundle protein
MAEYDLEKRTTNFAEEIIVFCRLIKKDEINRPMINQLIRSGTSIGANYCEANNACSKKDFQNKIFICKKEAQETRYWLKILVKANPEKNEEIKVLFKECQELLMIFQKIINSCRSKK